MHPPSCDKFVGSSSICNMEKKLDPMHVPEYLVVDFWEDDDMHSSTNPNIGTIEGNTDYFLGDSENDTECDDEIHIANVEFVYNKIGFVCMSCPREKELVLLNVLNSSNHRQDVISEDNMVHGGLSTDVSHNSAKKMWLGHKFPYCKNFRRTLAKFAIYNNFTIE